MKSHQQSKAVTKYLIKHCQLFLFIDLKSSPGNQKCNPDVCKKLCGPWFPAIKGFVVENQGGAEVARPEKLFSSHQQSLEVVWTFKIRPGCKTIIARKSAGQYQNRNNDPDETRGWR